jgi:hypothetical protein
MNVDSYPLQWPIGRPKTPYNRRKGDPFHMPGGKIRYDLAKELKLMGASDFVISTDLMVRKDGLPYAGQKAPEDPGVALYFTRKGMQICISCDQYHKLDANLRAIGKTVEAIRGIERWGTEEMMDAAFKGFTALPEGQGDDYAAKYWYEILEVSESATAEEIRDAWKAKMKKAHPDVGGDAKEFKRIQDAYEAGMVHHG